MRFAQISGGVVSFVIDVDAAPDASWIPCSNACSGWTYDGNAFFPPVDPCAWLIDLGPFYDRFGAAKMAVLTSTDTGVKAIIADLNIRKWVDLKRADVTTGLAYVGSKVPEVTVNLQTTILTTPVGAEENRALRKLYF